MISDLEFELVQRCKPEFINKKNSKKGNTYNLSSFCTVNKQRCKNSLSSKLKCKDNYTYSYLVLYDNVNILI